MTTVRDPPWSSAGRELGVVPVLSDVEVGIAIGQLDRGERLPEGAAFVAAGDVGGALARLGCDPPMWTSALALPCPVAALVITMPPYECPTRGTAGRCA